MRLSIWLTLAVATLAAVPSTCIGYTDAISRDRARRAGLEVQWFGQIQSDPSRDEVIEIKLRVHDSATTTYFELLYDGVREVISENDHSLRGERFGVTGAAEWANLRKEILEGEGRTVELRQQTVPKATLFTMTERGVIQAIDAESGKTLWTAHVGRPDFPATGLAANDRFVVAVKSSDVYCLKAETGDAVWSRRTRSTPNGGVSVSDQFAYVTELGGQVEIYPLNETGTPTRFFVSVGRPTSDPLITPTTVSWPTDKGHYNVASATEVKSVAYRLQTGDVIPARGAASNQRLIVVTKLGKVFGIDEQEGKISWEFSSGEPIHKAPVAIGKYVLVFTDQNHLLTVDVTTGALVEAWPQHIPGIRDFVGISGDLAYFMDTSNNLVALRKENGARVFSLPLQDVGMIVPNTQSDRLYLSSRRGALVCLREIGHENPTFFGDQDLVAAPGEAPPEQRNPFDTGKPGEAPSEPQPKKSTNPFETKPDSGKSSNPFEPGGNKSDQKPPGGQGGGDNGLR